MRKIIFLYLFVNALMSVQAQNSVSGSVTDRRTAYPLKGWKSIFPSWKKGVSRTVTVTSN